MPDALVLYASVEGQTERIAQRIASTLRAQGHRVDVASADAPLDASRYDGVIVGASVHYGHHPAWLATRLRGLGLDGRRSAFFSVSLGVKQRYATKFLHKARWRPSVTAVFAGALNYSKYCAFKRLVVRAFAAIGGHDTDTSRDYEYTDWQAVERFSVAVGKLIGR